MGTKATLVVACVLGAVALLYMFPSTSVRPGFLPNDIHHFMNMSITTKDEIHGLKINTSAETSEKNEMYGRKINTSVGTSAKKDINSPKIRDPGTSAKDNIYARKFFSERNYENSLMQFNDGISKPPRSLLESLPKLESSKSIAKVPPKYSLEALAVDHTVHSYTDEIHIEVEVSKNGLPVSGCSFIAREYFAVDNDKRVTMCAAWDHFNGTYSIACVNPGVTREEFCVDIHIELTFCYYEAYEYVTPGNRTLIRGNFCFDPSPYAPDFRKQHEILVSWSHDTRNHCEKLFFNNVLQRRFTEHEVCECVSRYDKVYLVGTSHMGHFSDYVMHTCAGLDLIPIKSGLKHGDIEAGNLYFRDGRYIKDLHHRVQSELETWLHKADRVALWIQTGCWDLFRIGIVFAIEVALDYYEQMIIDIQSKIKKTNSTVDVYILSSPPRPSGHTVDKIAISAFNAKLHSIAQRHGVSFINEFAIVEPCSDDVPTLGGNHHHYLVGYRNIFEGTVGFNFYSGVFLPTVCNRL